MSETIKKRISNKPKKTIDNDKKSASRNFASKSKNAGASASVTNKKESDFSKSPKSRASSARKHSRSTVKKSASENSVRIVFLGGLNQIGKNIMAIECNDDIIIVDCGMSFPDGEMLGVDLVIPDFSYLESNRERIKGLVITHGHEDHIGSIPYLLRKINVPIYATPLTVGLITSKLKEHLLVGST